MQASTDKEFIKSLAKGLSIIEYLNQRATAATLSEVAHATDTSRAAARRCLLTLQTLGYVDANGPLFKLTPNVLKLSSAFAGDNSLAAVATPYLKQLTEACGESCSMSVLQGEQIVYIARESASRIMSVNIKLGGGFPALYTSMGRTMIAHLSEAEIRSRLAMARLKPLTPYTLVDATKLKNYLSAVRKKGYALVNQELELGLISLAVPVFEQQHLADQVHQKRPLAAINIACSSAIHKPAHLVSTFVPLLQQTAAAIEAALQGSATGD
jgi:IclR family pca regulon transcriptional regulator